MRVLAHIHTFNDADIIERTLAMVRRQTRPVDGILIVDNASTDAILDQPSVEGTAIIRHEQNLGTSGAVGVWLWLPCAAGVFLIVLGELPSAASWSARSWRWLVVIAVSRWRPRAGRTVARSTCR